MKKLLLFLVLLLSLNINAQGPPPKEDLPVLSNFRIESNEPSRVYFDSSKEITGSSKKGFVISGKTISKLSISSGQTTGHYFTVNSPFTFWDNNTIRLGENTDTSDVNPILHNFTLSYIENNINEPTAPTNKYVTISASGGGNGDSEGTAWTLREAFSNATAGITVWIKAGDYGNINIQVNNDGTISNPVKFIGYKTTIGDITSNYFDYGVTWTASEMPTLTGGGNSEAFQLNGTSFTILKNIQIKGYRYGIRANQTTNNNLVFERINIDSQDNSGSYGIWTETFSAGAFSPYESNNKTKYIDIRVLNSGMANIYSQGEGGNLFEGIKTYNDIPAGEITDYQITIGGDNNIIRNCHSENIDNSSTYASTHGIGVRASWNTISKYNLIEKSTALNISECFYLRNVGADYNVIKDCTASSNNTDISGGIAIWGGADYNIIERVKISKTRRGVVFYDNLGEDGDTEADAGHNNIFRNCIFDDVVNCVYIDAGNNLVVKVYDNKFINCTFNNTEVLLWEDTGITSDVQNLDFINCLFNDVLGSSGFGAEGNMEGIADFTYSDFYLFKKSSGTYYIPSGVGNINEDPQYLNPSNDDFTPQNILLNKGEKLIDVPYDINGKERIGQYTIGAFEYIDKTMGSVNANAGSDESICLGESVTLRASGGSTYSWSTGATTESITVNPNTTTTYTVTVSEGGASGTDSVQVAVNNVIANADSNKTINEGENVTLTASGGGTYKWSTGATTQAITVSPDTTTTYSVTVTNNGCEDTDEVVVTVNTSIGSVTANAGSDESICLGESVTLTASGGSSYSWSTGATTESITVNPNTTTTYTVTVSEGGASGTDSVQVTVNNVTANAGSDKTIDQGESVKLTASGGEMYLWSTGESTKSITVSPTTTKIYTVITTINGCEDNDSVEVTVVEIKISNPPTTIASAGDDISICLGESITLTADGRGTYTWSTGANQKIIQVNPTRTTIYTLKATSDGITTIDSVMVSVENCNISSTNQDALKSELVVYPNPSKGDLNIKVSGQDGKELNLVLISVNGKIVYRDKMNPNLGTITKQINLSGLAKGIYYVKLFNSNQNVIKKILMI